MTCPALQVDGTIEKRFAKKEVLYPMEVRNVLLLIATQARLWACSWPNPFGYPPPRPCVVWFSIGPSQRPEY